jgi:hypothetical protein
LKWGGGSPSFISSSSNVALLDTVNAFTAAGMHTFNGSPAAAQAIQIVNTHAAGTTENAYLDIGTDNFAGNFGRILVRAFSGSYTPTSGWDQPSSGVVIAGGIGGLSLIDGASTAGINFYIGSTWVQRLDTNGDWRPDADNSRRVGLATHRYTLIRGVTITSGDFAFENGWTITESLQGRHRRAWPRHSRQPITSS